MVTLYADMPQIDMNENVVSMHHHQSERELVQEIKAGNNACLYKLYKMYAPSLLGIILKVIKFDDIAEDVLQESFVKIWKSIHKYDPDKGKLFTWMAKVARNTAIDYVRGQACAKCLKTTEIEIATYHVEKHNPVFYNIDTIGLRELINVLPQAQKQIVDLVYFQGYTQLEVSDQLQMPLGSVKSKIRYAILMLRGHFK
ncbi:RNA polymerase sigma factor [Pedobacter sp. AW31-3R]|uniref:RNA polymerase sigma factor n=1 Tax=Pedobacter sp. AW31-3R TaxID=3445781 RepID=UPI003FA10165